jgi:TonB family protein
MNTKMRLMACALLAACALLHPAARSADVGGSGPHPPPLPPIVSSAQIAYPGAAKQAGREGRVLLAFGISDRGLATNASILFADDASFNQAAIELLSGLRFRVPRDWDESGSLYKRFQLGVVFCIPPSAQSEVFADVGSPIVIMTDRVQGSPVLNPLPAHPPKAAPAARAANSEGGCATHAKL